MGAPKTERLGEVWVQFVITKDVNPKMVSVQYLSRDFRAPKASPSFIRFISALLFLGYHII